MKLLQIALSSLPLLLTGCLPQKGNAIRVATSTTIVADLARTILGDVNGAEVVALMPPGSDPHTQILSAESVAQLQEADVVLLSGLKLEDRAEARFLDRGGDAIVLAIAEAIPNGDLILTGEQPDPHVWGDPRLWAKCLDAVVAALSEALPEHQGDFARNADTFRQKLVELHHWASLRTSQIPETKRVLTPSHNAFRYFGKAYGIEIAAPGIGPEFGGKLYYGSVGPAGEMETADGETYDLGTYIGAFKHNVNTIVTLLQ